MIKSMTGFGIATTNHNNSKFSVEIKSLNSKFLELNLKLPKSYSEKELFLRNLCNREIERGKVTININIETDSENVQGANINEVLLEKYFLQLSAIDKKLNANTNNLLQIALNLPDVITYKEDQTDDADWEVLHQTFLNALQNFNEFRLTEGNTLEKDLQLRINNILDFFAQLEKLEPQRIPAIKAKLQQFIEENNSRIAIDNNRLEQELIYYIEKLDITEEKTRLKSHCSYFLKTLNNTEGNGKKLGFIAQEIGREINTIGSKANDAGIQQLVVGMKEELEKIKEQLLNIL